MPFASASSDIVPYALPIDTATVYVSNSIRYGVSASNARTINAGWYHDIAEYGGNVQIGQYSTSASTGYYFSSSNSFYIQITYDVDEYYMDSQSVDVLLNQGHANLYVDGGSSAPVFLTPTSCSLLINNSFVGESFPYDPGTDIAISYDLTEQNSQVYNYGVRYYFSETTKTGVGITSSLRRLWLDTSSSTLTFNVHQTEQGLFATLFGWLSGIKDGISNVVSGIASGFTNVVNAITSLPGLIIDGIKNLFIPSEDDLTALQTKYEDMLEQKLGFVWQAGTILTNFANSIISAFTSAGSYSFQFPGISVSLNGTNHVIVASQTVSLDNAYFDVIRPVLGIIVQAICVIGFIRIAEHMLTALVSGASYFEFLTRKGE